MANGGDTNVDARFGGLDLHVVLHPAARSVDVQGRTFELANGNVILVDQVDAVGGPTILGTRMVDPALPGPNGGIVTIIRTSEELRTFLRCGAALPDPALQPVADILCAQVAGRGRGNKVD